MNEPKKKNRLGSNQAGPEHFKNIVHHSSRIHQHLTFIKNTSKSHSSRTHQEHYSRTHNCLLAPRAFSTIAVAVGWRGGGCRCPPTTTAVVAVGSRHHQATAASLPARSSGGEGPTASLPSRSGGDEGAAATAGRPDGA